MKKINMYIASLYVKLEQKMGTFLISGEISCEEGEDK